jgi:Fusaric acid resistance protein family
MRMVNARYQVGQAPNDSATGRWGPAWVDAATAAGPPLLYTLRLWASVCLALYIAFWLELDNPFWAGTSAAIVCQPQLGASLRKGWFRMIGTVVGAATIVVLTALFPQDRIGFLVLLAVWGGICAFTATVLHNFASYSAALAGYTAAIIAADTLGATGGPSPDVFMLAHERDLHRDRLRRGRSRGHRFWRRPAAAGHVLGRSSDRDLGRVFPHAGYGGTAAA